MEAFEISLQIVKQMQANFTISIDKSANNQKMASKLATKQLSEIFFESNTINKDLKLTYKS